MESKEKLAVQLSKDLNASVNEVYDAWINAEALKQWWRPMNNQLKEVQNELQPGGAIKYVFQTEEGKEAFQITGNYKEVQPAQKLVYTWNWQLQTDAVSDSEFLLTIEFGPQGSGSRLSVTQENFQHEENIQPHREGWEKALNDLAQFVEKK